MPPGGRYTSTLPKSGENDIWGSSVVMRHCMAKPWTLMSSWDLMPISSRVAPPAMRICDCTRSMPVTSSVTVCSTWMRGFTSRK